MSDEIRDITYRIRVDTADLETSMAAIDQRVTSGIGAGIDASTMGIFAGGYRPTISERVIGSGSRYAESIASGEIRESANRIGEKLSSLEGVVNSAYLRERGYRPLDMFVGEERRLMLMESMSIPYSARLLSMQERGAIGTAGQPYLPGISEAVEQQFPGFGGLAYPGVNLLTGGFLDYMFGVSNMARQQQASAAAGIIAQTGGNVSQQSIVSMMNSFSAIQQRLPGARPEDIALAAGIVQREGFIPNQYEGVRRVQEVASAMEMLSMQFGITDLDQRRQLAESLFAAGVPSESFERVGIAAKTISTLSGRDMGESFSRVLSARAMAGRLKLSPMVGEESAKYAEAYLRSSGISPGDLSIMGGPETVRSEMNYAIMYMASHPGIKHATQEMFEKTGSFEFNESAFLEALRSPGNASREFTSKNIAELEMNTTRAIGSNSIAMIRSAVRVAEEKGITQDHMDKWLSNNIGISLSSAKVAREMLDREQDASVAELQTGKDLLTRETSRNVYFDAAGEIFRNPLHIAYGAARNLLQGKPLPQTRLRGTIGAIDVGPMEASQIIRMYGDPDLAITQAEGSAIRAALRSAGMSDEDISDAVSSKDGYDTFNLQAMEEFISSSGIVESKRLQGVTEATKGMLSARLMREHGIENEEFFRGIVRGTRSALAQGKTREEISQMSFMMAAFEGDSASALEFLKRQEFTFVLSGGDEQLVVTPEEQRELAETGKITARERKIRPRKAFTSRATTSDPSRTRDIDDSSQELITAISNFTDAVREASGR